MGNLLEFSLGLQASEFITKLGISGAEVLSFVSVTETLRKAWEHTWETIDQGAELRGLSSATGESVSQLYRFQQGLQAIGGQTQSLAEFFMLTQNALSGVNAAGVRTDMLFAKLGLNIQDLRKEDTVKAITDIAGALRSVNSTQAAGIAEAIFGRYQAMSILQITRNMGVFNQGFTGSAATAALLQKFADTFEQVKADAQMIQNDVLGIWVTVAGKVAPELHAIFTRVHEDVRQIGPALLGAIQSGHVSELFTDALAAAFEQGSYFGERVFSALAVGFGDALFAAVKAVFEDAIPAGLSKIKADAEVAELEAQNTVWAQAIKMVPTTGKMTPAEMKERQQQIAGLNALIQGNESKINDIRNGTADDVRQKMADAAAQMSSGMTAAIADAVQDWQASAGKGPHVMLDRLKAVMDKYTASAIAGIASDSASSGGGTDFGNLQARHYKMEFTPLEKMGFVMSGRIGNPLENHKISLLTSIDRTLTKIADVKIAPLGSTYIQMASGIVHPGVFHAI